MTEQKYEAELLDGTISKIFRGVYNDFKNKAISEYKFELEPLEYDDFISAVEKKYLKCIVLKENDIPTAFLVYTTSISESIELNIIHCIGSEDETQKQALLIEKFLQLTEVDRKNKVVSYPMLGHQSAFTADIAKYGFKFIGLAVMRFLIGNPSSERILQNVKLNEIPDGYKVVAYEDAYRESAIKVFHESFKDSQDAIYDTRYKTIDGTRDIINKVVESIYGDFLPEASSVLLYKDKPCGFVFSNLTGGKIANIPLVTIEKSHRNKGFSVILLNRTIKMLVDWANIGKLDFSEINVTTETNNYKALKMYRKVGFRENYCYPQAYLLNKSKKIHIM